MRAQQDARREVLDLALAVDRRIRDHRYGLVEVVCEVRPRGERGERSVVAERADRLVPGLGHVGGVLQVVGLEPEGRELPLPADRDVLHLVGRDADLPAPAGVHRLGGAAAGDALAEPVEHHPAGAPGGEEPRADGVLIDEAPAAVAPQRDVLAGAKRIRIGDVALERDESALAREYVLVLGLDVPERAKAERVDAKDAGVTDAREDRRGSLRERTERGARLHVHVLQLAAHPLHLIHDRREEELDRFYGGEAVPYDESADHRIHVLRIAAVARQNKPESTCLFAQATDGVDLTVVREDREGLNAGEAGGRVRGIAVVPEGRGRGEPRIAEIREVRGELMAGAAQLVHGGMSREGNDGRRGGPLDVQRGLVERAGARVAGTPSEERELEEPRRLEAATGSERALVRRLSAREEDGDPVTLERIRDLRLGGAFG